MGGSRGTKESRDGCTGESPGDTDRVGARARRLRCALVAPALALALLLLAAGGSALQEISEKLARADLREFETQGRFIKSRYGEDQISE